MEGYDIHDIQPDDGDEQRWNIHNGSIEFDSTRDPTDLTDSEKAEDVPLALVCQRILGILTERSMEFRRIMAHNRRRSIERIRRRQSLLRLQYFHKMIDIHNKFLSEIPLPRMQVPPAPDCDTEVNAQFWETVMKDFGPNEWLQTFRISKSTFEWICEQVSGDMKPGKVSVPLKNLISLEKRVALSLYTLANGADYRTVAQLFGVSRTSVCKFMRRFCLSFIKKTETFLLTMPCYQEVTEIMEGFETLSGLPLVVGCLGTHHMLVSPPPDEVLQYLNEKRYPTIILQALVDNKMLFRKICLGSREPTMFVDSPDDGFPAIEIDVGNEKISSYVVGSPSFPLRGWLMKKIPQAETISECQLNDSLEKILMVKNRAFARLFARWKILTKKADLEPKTMEIIANACCALHNLVEENGDVFQEEWKRSLSYVKFQPIEEESEDSTMDGANVQRLLANYLSKN